jgi:hypothetical protein
MNLSVFRITATLIFAAGLHAADQNHRPPKDEDDLRQWLENMIWHHEFNREEIKEALGLSEDEIDEAIRKNRITPERKPKRRVGDPLLVLPYPGGRHPRIGFLDGAVDPQRETKLSIFTPWDDSSYVVADVPEAIWSNLGLTYLAHTHIATIWTKQNIVLPKLEWTRRASGEYVIERTLPNGIRFGTLARSTPVAVLMKMWLSNGTSQALSDLRVQNCVMLKGAKGFAAQTNENKVMKVPFAACRSETGKRWVITAWQPLHRAWANAPCPCLHSDPKFPNAQPGETKTLYGLVSFFEGTEIEPEFRRLQMKWDEWMRF